MSIASPPPPPTSSAMFCGRCGAAFTGGGFCGRCGNLVVTPPPAATGYSYPVLAAATVPAMQHRISHRNLWLITGVVIGIIAVVVTIIVVAVKPRTHPCGYYCGPHAGPRLLSSSVYTSSKYNVVVEYPNNRLQVQSQSDSSVSFAPTNGSDGQEDVTISSGSDVDSAITNTVNSLPSANFQDVQAMGDVHGAQVGLVPGRGTAYSAIFVPNNGGQSVPVTVMVIGAAKNGLTVVATMFSDYSKDVANGPYGLALGQDFDFPLTNLRYPGS